MLCSLMELLDVKLLVVWRIAYFLFLFLLLLQPGIQHPELPLVEDVLSPLKQGSRWFSADDLQRLLVSYSECTGRCRLL